MKARPIPTCLFLMAALVAITAQSAAYRCPDGTVVSEAPECESKPAVSFGSETFGPAGYKTFQRYLGHGLSDKAIAMLKADSRWASFRDEGDFRSLYTPLHYAAAFGDIEAVRWLLDHGADVNAIAVNDATPLHLTENPRVVELILEGKPDLTLRSNGQTPLQNAADKLNPGRVKGRDTWLEIIKLMLRAGAEYDIITAICLDDVPRVKAILKSSPELANRVRRECPLRTAAKLGRVEICRYLIDEYHVDVNDFEGGVGYPIIKGALAYPEIVRLLIENGADLKTRITWQGGRSGVWLVDDDATALHFAACDGVPETIDLLIDNGVDIFAVAQPISGETDNQNALEVAAYFGKADNARAILGHPKFVQANEHVRQKLLDKCLLIGAFPAMLPSQLTHNTNRPQLVELVLDSGANPNSSKDGRTAMLIAARGIHPTCEQNQQIREMIASLIDHGAKLDLFSAVAIGDEVQVARLLEQDPKLADSRHPDGHPALHFAVGMNYKKIVAALLNAGCAVDIRNKCSGTGYIDETPLHCAAFWGRYDIAKLLIEAGADVNALTERKSTPLHDAARTAEVKMVQLLLENGANPDALDKDGKTPLDGCHDLSKKDASEVEELFRAHRARH